MSDNEQVKEEVGREIDFNTEFSTANLEARLTTARDSFKDEITRLDKELNELNSLNEEETKLVQSSIDSHVASITNYKKEIETINRLLETVKSPYNLSDDDKVLLVDVYVITGLSQAKMLKALIFNSIEIVSRTQPVVDGDKTDYIKKELLTAIMSQYPKIENKDFRRYI